MGTKINSKGDMISLKIKKEDETLSDKIQSIIKSEKWILKKKLKS